MTEKELEFTVVVPRRGSRSAGYSSLHGGGGEVCVCVCGGSYAKRFFRLLLFLSFVSLRCFAQDRGKTPCRQRQETILILFGLRIFAADVLKLLLEVDVF